MMGKEWVLPQEASNLGRCGQMSQRSCSLSRRSPILSYGKVQGIVAALHGGEASVHIERG